MCTLIVLHQLIADHPLIVVSNRDEHPGRPSTKPYFWEEHDAIYAPRDLVLGGTWIGVNRHGLFAAITNCDNTPHYSGRASRGRLVADVLHAHTARGAAILVAANYARHAYNGFHLVVADAHELCLILGHGPTLHTEWHGPSCMIVTGYGVGGTHCARAEEIERRINNLKSASVDELDTLINFHANGEPTAAACVHDPNEFHKTISSMIIRTDRNRSAFETWFRDGPACAKPFEDKMDIQISNLRRAS